MIGAVARVEKVGEVFDLMPDARRKEAAAKIARRMVGVPRG